MAQSPVYMDNQSTTRVDPRVLEAMLPYFGQHYGNAGSSSHAWGRTAKEAVDSARQRIAARIGASPREIVFTSGATESNNLALRGVCERARQPGRHLVSVVSEHRAILDPLAKLAKRGFEVTLLPVLPNGRPDAGCVELDALAAAIRPDTILVSVMLANNEIGVIQPLEAIGRLCRDRGVLLHSDATQAVGKIPVKVDQLPVDLMSFSAHKLYGPKGIGALYVRRRAPQVRLESQIDGGRQENGLRSGTLNVPGIVGLDAALEFCCQELPAEHQRLADLRDRLYRGLARGITGIGLNGPVLDDPALRLPGNLNCSFGDVEGESLMLGMPDVAVSSGSACTSADPTPSHVLQALGLSVEQARTCLRFGLGRFNTAEEVDVVVETATAAARRLREAVGR